MPEEQFAKKPITAREVYETTLQKALQEKGRDEGLAARTAWLAVRHFYDQRRQHGKEQ